MDINFEYNNVKASNRLETLVTEKINKLVDKYDFVIRADVFFRTENTSSPETGMICNIRLSAPGPRLFAEASHDTFEASIKESIKDLERQLKKEKKNLNPINKTIEDMSVLTTDENLLTLVYSSESHLGKQVLGYVQGADKKLRTIDIAKTNLGHTVWVTIAEGLNKPFGKLFSIENAENLDIGDHSSFDTDDWLKLIDKNPSLLQKPIAIKGKEFLQVSGRSEVLKFFGVDSAGLEKKPIGKTPTTSSTTQGESFV